MYDLTELLPGISPPGAPWGSPFTRENPKEWMCDRLFVSVVEPKPTTTMAIAWKGEHHGNPEQDKVH